MADIIPFDKRQGTIWVDGQLVDWQDAKTHILNHGLHYASSVFEGVRAYNGVVFKNREHAERFKKSAELLDFTIPYSVDEIMAATNEVVRANNIVDGYIRPVAFRGSEMMAISAQHATTHVAIATWVWPHYMTPEMLEKGITMKTATWRRPAPDTAPTASKAAGLYMICTMSKHQVEREGYQEALMLDYRGYIAEATGANIFLVINGEIHTPTPDCFLDGITRRTVMELARKRGYTLIERHIKPEELANAQEVFLTGTAAEVKPVQSIDAHRFTVGPITRQLIADYDQLVRHWQEEPIHLAA